MSEILKITEVTMPSTELEQSTIDTVKATAPLVAENATKITSLFYQILFDEHPEQKSVFNMSHHRKGNGGMTSSQVMTIRTVQFTGRLIYIKLYSMHIVKYLNHFTISLYNFKN